jgi:hypothetical protein
MGAVMSRVISALVSHLTTPRLILRRGADQLAYLTRWGIRTPWFNVFLHRFDGEDPGVHLHDHPWTFLSIILRGAYEEQRCPIDTACMRARLAERGRWSIQPGSPVSHYTNFMSRFNWMPMDTCHRIVWVKPGTFSLVFTGPNRRDKGWGFYTPSGYVPHDQYEHEDRSLTSEYPRPLSRAEQDEYR